MIFLACDLCSVAYLSDLHDHLLQTQHSCGRASHTVVTDNVESEMFPYRRVVDRHLCAACDDRSVKSARPPLYVFILFASCKESSVYTVRNRSPNHVLWASNDLFPVGACLSYDALFNLKFPQKSVSKKSDTFLRNVGDHVQDYTCRVQDYTCHVPNST